MVTFKETHSHKLNNHQTIQQREQLQSLAAIIKALAIMLIKYSQIQEMKQPIPIRINQIQEMLHIRMSQQDNPQIRHKLMPQKKTRQNLPPQKEVKLLQKQRQINQRMLRIMSKHLNQKKNKKKAKKG